MRVTPSEILGFKAKRVFKTIVLLIHCETSFNFFLLNRKKTLNIFSRILNRKLFHVIQPILHISIPLKILKISVEPLPRLLANTLHDISCHSLNFLLSTWF